MVPGLESTCLQHRRARAVISTVLPEVKDLGVEARVLCRKITHAKFYPPVMEFCAPENCQEEGVFKWQTGSCHLPEQSGPPYLTFLPASSTTPC